MNNTFHIKKAENKAGYIISGLILLAFIFFSSCGGSGPDPKPEPTEQEKVTALLTAHTWKPASGADWVTIDGFEAAELFTNFTITFTKTGYSTTGNTPVWRPSSGNWRFLTGSTSVIVRDSDSLQVTINTLTETTLKFTLYWATTTDEGGRQKSLAGTHVFNFTK